MKFFNACLGTWGVFSDQKQICIIWIGLLAPELVILAKKVNVVLRSLVPLQNRFFESHVTIARVKKINDCFALQTYFESIKVEPISFTVNNFLLKRSDLFSQRAQYSLIEGYSLQ